jgi:Ion transport protein
MMKISPDNVANAALIEAALQLDPTYDGILRSKTMSLQTTIENFKTNCIELSLSEQLEVSLKLAQHLKDLANQQSAREFFFVRFKRQLFKKNLIDRIEHRIEKLLSDTHLRIRAANNEIYKACFLMQDSKLFQVIIIIAIFGNAIDLALSKYPIDLEFESQLEYWNIFFFFFFLFELAIKLIGRGFKSYYTDLFNWFDSAVVLISSIDLFMQ